MFTRITLILAAVLAFTLVSTASASAHEVGAHTAANTGAYSINYYDYGDTGEPTVLHNKTAGSIYCKYLAAGAQRWSGWIAPYAYKNISSLVAVRSFTSGLYVVCKGFTHQLVNHH